jgi:hypothetical protein
MNLKLMLYGSMLKIKNFIMQRMNPLLQKESKQTTNLYQSINKLPLSIFIDCLVDNEFNKLIIEGEATNEQLQQAWEKVMEEYGNAVAPNEVSNKLQDVKTLARKEYQIKRIELVLDLLDKFPCEKIYNMLFTFGYTLPKLKYSNENVNKVVSILLGYFRRDITDYQILAKKIEEKAQEQPKNKYTRQYFDDVLSSICTALKLPSLSIETMTLGAYCAYLRRYNTFIKSQQK